MTDGEPTVSPWDRLPMRTRLAHAAIVAAAVLVISIVSDWLSYRESFDYLDAQATTQSILRRLDREIFDFRVEHDQLPESLDQLSIDSWPGDDMAWPIHYRQHEDEYELFSLGLDGKPGGSGFDCDLHADRWEDPRATPGLYDFLVHQPSAGMVFSCLVTSFLTFFLVLFISRRGSPAWIWSTNVIAVLVFSSVVAVSLSSLHIPFFSAH